MRVASERPLTALMMEQRAKFSVKGVTSEFVGELQQDVDALSCVKKGQLQLLYISPESLLRNPQVAQVAAAVEQTLHCVFCSLHVYYEKPCEGYHLLIGLQLKGFIHIPARYFGARLFARPLCVGFKSSHLFVGLDEKLIFHV